jgi:hypothetical protein
VVVGPLAIAPAALRPIPFAFRMTERQTGGHMFEAGQYQSSVMTASKTQSGKLGILFLLRMELQSLQSFLQRALRS